MLQSLHPFANHTFTEIEMTQFLGPYLLTDGKDTYLDAISGLYNCPLGYNALAIKDAIITSLDILPTNHIFSICPDYAQTNTYLEQFKIELSKQVNFAKTIFFANSGSEATDRAIGICKLLSNDKRKKKIMGYSRGYHGCTEAAFSASGNLIGKTENSIFVDFYAFYDIRSVDEYLSYIELQILENGPDSILAFIAEPMLSAGGGFFMKENILPKLKTLLNNYNIRLILDEVVSGFGRLGCMFAYQKYNVIPDILVLSKAITNGYIPMACCITSFDIHPEVNIPFGFTTAGSPVAAAAAIATMQIIYECLNTSVVSKAGKCFYNYLLDYGVDKKCYKICHEGLYFSIHLSKDSSKYVPYPFEENIGGTYAKDLLQHRIITRGSSRSLIIAPGFLMKPDQLNFIAKTVAKTLL